jgi:hypothetical protein
MAKLLYVGQDIADSLADNVADNLDRYRQGDFLDLEAKGDWRIPLSFDVDISELSELKQGKSPECEIENSLLVGRSLCGLNPALARENRLWLRLSHVECLEYSRQRWLTLGANDEKLANDIKTHFFAPTLTGCRDDHAISRLWWNHHIAKQIMPEDPARALKVMLARADIRLNFLERPGLAARPSLGKGIVNALERNVELLKQEDLFRRFMKTLNLLGAGIAFEVWSNDTIDRFMDRCLNVHSPSNF